MYIYSHTYTYYTYKHKHMDTHIHFYRHTERTYTHTYFLLCQPQDHSMCPLGVSGLKASKRTGEYNRGLII